MDSKGSDSSAKMEMEAFLPPEKKIDKKPNPLSTLLRNPKVLVISLLSIVVVGWMTFLTLKVSKESLSETEIDFPEIAELLSEMKKKEDESRVLLEIVEHYAQLRNNHTNAENLQVDFEREERAVLQTTDDNKDCTPKEEDVGSGSDSPWDDILRVLPGLNQISEEHKKQFRLAYNKLTAMLQKKLDELLSVPLNRKEIDNIHLIRKFERELNCTSFRKKEQKLVWMGQLQRKLFYKMVLANKDGDLRGLQINSRYSVGKLRQAAFEFDLTIQASGITKVVAGAGGIALGVASLTAVILSPFTLGASLAILPVTAGLGGVTSLVSFGSSVGETAHMKTYAEKAKKLQEFAEVEISEVNLIMEMYIDAENRFQEVVKSENIKKVSEAIKHQLIMDMTKIGIPLDKAEKLGNTWEKSTNLVANVFTASLRSADKNLNLLVHASTVAASIGLVSASVRATATATAKGLVKFVVPLTGVAVESVTKAAAAQAAGSVAGVISIGSGIWDVFLGARTINGIGNIGDKFRAAALEQENKVAAMIDAFELLTGRQISSGTTSELLNIIEFKSCQGKSISSNIYAKLSAIMPDSTNEKKCTTGKLNLKKNDWSLNIENLGECSNFEITNFTASITVVNNNPYEKTCIDYITLATEGKFVPSLVCYRESTENIGREEEILGGQSVTFQCSRHPTIARIKTHTCSSCKKCDYGAKTNDPVHLQLKFENKENTTIENGLCATNQLKVADGQFGYDSKDIFRLDTFGECMDKRFEPVKDFHHFGMKILKDGYDDWCTDSIKIYTPGFFQDYNIFRCNVFNKGIGTIASNLQDLKCPLVKSSGCSTAIERIDFHVCNNNYAGSGVDNIRMTIWTKTDNDEWKTCTTNNLNYNEYWTADTTYSIDGEMYLEDDGGERLGECEGFEIHNNRLWFNIDSNSMNGWCLDTISFFGKKKQDAKLTPFMKCDYKALWSDSRAMTLDGKTKQFVECEDQTHSPIDKMMFKVCDSTKSTDKWYNSFIPTFAGTDSTIRAVVTSDEGKNKCEVTLNSARDDFEAGDFNTFKMRNNVCSTMEIVNDNAEMKIYNDGQDNLCLSHV